MSSLNGDAARHPAQQRLVSVVVPAYNEAQSLPQLYEEIARTFEDGPDEFEVLIVDDGSSDETPAVLHNMLLERGDHLQVIRLRRNFGKAAALMEGFRSARGARIVMMDGDLQDSPSEVPKLLEMLDGGYDAVSGWKQKRKDSRRKRIASKLFNRAVNTISVAQLHDHGCGLKALRAEAARSLDLYGSLHRFIVPLLESNGYRVAEVPVEHRARRFGHSKFGGTRLLEGVFDFITVIFITRFRQRPLHFFGFIGMSCSALGLGLGVYLTLYKVIGHHSIGTRPLLLLALVLVIVGVQLTAMGLIGEQLAAMPAATFSGRPSRRVSTPRQPDPHEQPESARL
ncbi:MAG TPA: glycosyltransferase family 2 protein [Solirubrobacteraceae bacterium]|nr:glycosyltransferase family 2 protein [Solirubrobacteraceae bacterium]